MDEIKIPKKNFAFIDGSFNPETKEYGCGGFLVDQFGKKHIIKTKRSDNRMVKMRNVAGEILGARLAVTLALGLGMKTLTLFYDYDGVEKWATGEWSCKKDETKSYRDFIQNITKNGLKLYFQHVKGHAGILENEEADKIAKEAVGIFKKE